MFDRLSKRDQWTYLSIAGLLVFGIAWTVARKLRPVGPVEIHEVSAPVVQPLPEQNSKTTAAEPAQMPASTEAQVPQGEATQSPGSATVQPVSAAALSWLNSASEDDLQDLPGIGAAFAKRIADTRQQIGGFQTLEDLSQVQGIGPKRLEKIRAYLTDKFP